MKFRIISTLLLASATLSAFNSQAYVYTSINTKVTSLYTFGKDHGPILNHTLVKASPLAPGCKDGYYISAEDKALNSDMISFALSAFHTKSSVRIDAYSDILLPGSSPGQEICKINSVVLIQ
jgi:hypothetical protein